MQIRMLLADDHPVFAEGVRVMLEQQDDIEVIDVLEDGREAVRTALAEEPDVILMDVSMPGMNGIEATHQITSALTGTKVICLSMHTDKRFILAVLEAGAFGYVLKDSPFDCVLLAIRTVIRGDVFLSPAITNVVVDAYKSERGTNPTSAFSRLTVKEREVLQLLAEGYSSKEIASRLCVSEKTISTHREHLMAKLNIRSIAGLTKYAIREGLTEINE